MFMAGITNQLETAKSFCLGVLLSLDFRRILAHWSYCIVLYIFYSEEIILFGYIKWCRFGGEMLILQK